MVAAFVNRTLPLWQLLAADVFAFVWVAVPLRLPWQLAPCAVVAILTGTAGCTCNVFISFHSVKKVLLYLFIKQALSTLLITFYLIVLDAWI